METIIVKSETLRNKILRKLKVEIAKMHDTCGQLPGIAFVGFSDVPLGKYTIPFHVKQARQLGFRVIEEVFTSDATEEELFACIEALNQNEQIHAIEILQPLPEHLNPLRIVSLVEPAKEVEGFHPENMKKVLSPNESENFTMCLPEALNRLLNAYDLHSAEEDQWVVVIDEEFQDNPLVSQVTRTALKMAVKELSCLRVVLKNENKLVETIRKADYLVVVSKEVGFIKAAWLKQGVVIIDIYSNLVKEVPARKNPDQLVPIIRGAVDPFRASQKPFSLYPEG